MEEFKFLGVFSDPQTAPASLVALVLFKTKELYICSQEALTELLKQAEKVKTSVPLAEIKHALKSLETATQEIAAGTKSTEDFTPWEEKFPRQSLAFSPYDRPGQFTNTLFGLRRGPVLRTVERSPAAEAPFRFTSLIPRHRIS